MRLPTFVDRPPGRVRPEDALRQQRGPERRQFLKANPAPVIRPARNRELWYRSGPLRRILRGSKGLAGP
jgi:hypothetical protein